MKKIRNYLFNIFIVLVLLLALPAGSSYAQNESALPVISGSVVHDYARITFEWPKPVNFAAKATGKTITVTFDREADPDFGELLSGLYPYVTSAQKKSDGRTIVISLSKPYQIRTFLTDNISGIDVLGIDPQEREALKQTSTDKKFAEIPFGKAPDPKAFAALQPAAGNDAPSPAKPEAVKDDSIDDDPLKAHADEKAKADAAHPETLKVGVSAAKDSAVIRLPFTERTALAVFIRNNYLWIVMGHSSPVDLTDFDNLPKTVIGKAELLEGKQTTLRVPLDDNIFAAVAKEDSSFDWAVLLTQVKRNPASPLKIDLNTDPPAPPHVFVNSLEMGDPITLKDPVIGDELIATPLFKLGEGVAIARDFVEFTALQTAQGVAIAKKSDEVEVTPLRNGLRVSMPQGITLTPGLPAVASIAAAESMQSSPTFFPYDKFMLDPDVSRHTQLMTLFQQTIENTNHREANEQRIRMAQIYLGEGLAAEAIGILGGINRTDPVFYRTSKLAALHGAANFLMYRFSEAARDFAASELNNNKEAEFWRNMLADLLGVPTKYDFLEMNTDYISKYPPLMRQRLAIIAANHAIDDKDYNVALKVFDTLQPEKDSKQENLTTSIKPYINYLFGKISTETGQAKEGVNTWDELAEDYSNPFVQTHAEFSRIVWDMNHDNLDKEHALERLEHLRISWHGDEMELKILELLGNMYNEKKDYVNAMRIWDNGVSSFPSTPIAIEMAHKMKETFVLMFSDEGASHVSPMDELVLYYQYKNYAPPAGAGRDIIDRLTDRLVAMDLLEQATTLLDHQMRFDSDKVQRTRIGAKMATIYLLAHQPTRALKALQDSVYGETPVTLHSLRNRIAGEALFETGELDRAKQILGHDDSLDAERIRLNIYWQKKDWPHVISTVEGMLKLRKDTSAPVNLDEGDAVLKLALAYIFQNDTLQLQYLHDYFGPLMANNPNKQVFDFITESDITPTPSNFDEVLNRLSETRSFIENYRAHIQTAGLESSNLPNGSATTKQ